MRVTQRQGVAKAAARGSATVYRPTLTSVVQARA
jgi:hypothetical protein